MNCQAMDHLSLDAVLSQAGAQARGACGREGAP